MARVRFTDDFDYRPTDNLIVAYKASPTELTVRRECAVLAVAAGAAVDLDAVTAADDDDQRPA